MTTPESACPADWNEAAYLALHPDVQAAVAAGQFSSGWWHYQLYGAVEGRRIGQPEPHAVHPALQTRQCFDPWTYLEITPRQGLKPCCKIGELDHWGQGDAQLMEVWRGPAFQQLRRELREGDLNVVCRSCHIRPWIPVAEFQDQLQTRGFGLDPGPLRTLRVEVTTACNLRCTYCPVSQPGYAAQSMTLASFEQVLTLLRHQDPDSLDLHLNGHGETTIHPQWLPFAQQVLALGFRPQLITNLARPLSDEEVETLSGFSVICVSLDTVDADLLRQMRRGVALEDLVRNLRRIRAAGAARPPAFRLSCGVYDQTVLDLERLAPFCAEHGVGAITFWQLVKYPDLPDALNARPIPSLPVAERRICVEAFERAVALLQARGIAVDVAGGFLEEWKLALQAG